MKHKTLTLLFMFLCIGLYAQRFIPTKNSGSGFLSGYSSSTPHLEYTFHKYIPLDELEAVDLDTTQTDKDGNRIYKYSMAAGSFQTYKKGVKKANKKEGQWKYYFIGFYTNNTHGNEDAVRSWAFFQEDRLLELLCSCNNIEIHSKEGISPEASSKIIDVIEDLEFRMPGIILGTFFTPYPYETVALNIIKDIIKEDNSQAEIYHFKHKKLQEYMHIEDGQVKDNIWLAIYKDPLDDKVTVEGKKKFYNEVLVYHEKYIANNQGRLVRSYYESGTRQSKGKYNNNNERIGKWKSFYPNGNLYEKGRFDEGRKIGLWKKYDDQGKLIAETRF